MCSVSRVSLCGGKWSVKTGDMETYWDARVPHSAADQISLLHTQIEQLRAALRRYGTHERSCPRSSGGVGCYCGLDRAVLSKEVNDGCA